jgi:hypothetical protein
MAVVVGRGIAARQRRPFCRERLDASERPGKRFRVEDPDKSTKGADLPSKTVLGNAPGCYGSPRPDCLLLNNQVRRMTRQKVLPP